jgi:glycosyltransferase involved in cell wall biosynthesis
MTRCLQDDQRSARGPGALAWPRISIVIPSYNQGRFIADAIESVLAQAYPDLELIVMDGGSTDQTVEVLRRYEDRLADWVSQPDGGQSDAINHGLDRSTGDVLGWLCCDDVLTGGALATVGRHFSAHPHCQWLTGAGEIRYLHTGKSSVGRSGVASPEALMAFWRWGAPGHYLCQPSTFWTRDMWRRAEGLRVDNHLAMDYELWLRFARHAMPAVIDDVLSISRIHPDCKSDRSRAGQVRETMRCAYAAAAAEGIGPVRFSGRLLADVMRGRVDRLASHWRGRWLGGSAAEVVRLLADPWLAWTEAGRMRMLRHL